jgi:signal transduction histidine kinase
MSRSALISASPSLFRALAECALLPLIFSLMLALPGAHYPEFIHNQAFFFAGQLAALWLALRLPSSKRGLRSFIRNEARPWLLLGFLVVLPALLVFCLAQPEGQAGIGLVFLPFGAWLSFILFRLIRAAWQAWQRLRRAHLIWNLVHTTLTLVFTMIMLASLVLVFINRDSLVIQELPTPLGSPLAAAFAWLINLILPYLEAVLLLSLGLMLLILPPALLVAYLGSRSAYQRLQSLVQGTESLAQLNFQTRLEVTGQDELSQLQVRFNQMASQLNSANQNLQQKHDQINQMLAAKKELSAKISHELRSPVTVASAYLESLLASQQLSPQLEQDLSIALGQMVGLKRLVEDLFTLSTAENQALDLKLEIMPPGLVLEKVHNAFAPLAWENRRLEVLLSIEKPLPNITVDPLRLEQALTNLLRNAIRHTPAGGVILIKGRQEGSQVILEVSDTGSGIIPEALEHIWERFYRAPSTPDEAGELGAGLGLAMVKELVEAMGGAVSVSSDVGLGSTFRLHFPV